MNAGVFRGYRMFVPVTVGSAALQTALLAADPIPEARWGFAALAMLSLLGLIAALWLTVHIAFGGLQHWRAGLAWSAGIVVLSAVVALFAIWATPVVLLLGLIVLPAAAAGASNPVAAGFAPLRRSPIRFVAMIFGALVAIGATWIVALVLGFFLTGLAAAFATWLWIGIVLSVALVGFARRAEWATAEKATRPLPQP